MTLKPNELSRESRSKYKKELIELENIIDEHLYEFYSSKDCQMPGIPLDEPKSIIKNMLIEKYEHAGWELSFELTNSPGKILLYLKEKKYIEKPKSLCDFLKKK